MTHQRNAGAPVHRTCWRFPPSLFFLLSLFCATVFPPLSFICSLPFRGILSFAVSSVDFVLSTAAAALSLSPHSLSSTPLSALTVAPTWALNCSLPPFSLFLLACVCVRPSAVDPFYGLISYAVVVDAGASLIGVGARVCGMSLFVLG